MKHFNWIGLGVTGICFWFLATMSSCSINDDPFYAEYTLEPFDTLFLNASFEVTLKQGDHFGIEVSGATEVTESISYQVNDRTLLLDNKDGALWKHPKLDPPTVIITFKTLSRIHAEETCNIVSADTIHMDTLGLTLGSKLNQANLQLDCELFYYWNTSPIGGQIILSGRADYVRFYNGSLMAIRADQLKTHSAIVVNGSKSDVHVFTDQQLIYSITGTGNIYLTGSPADIQAGPITSTGKLIQ